MTTAPETKVLTFSSVEEISALVRGFESGRLAREEWTHAAHLTVAGWYLARYPRGVATRMIREGIKRFNDAKGILTTRESGYHETMTLFWIHVVHSHLCSTTRADYLSLFNELIARHGGDRTLPFEYYSRERLMSWEARTAWVEPDLKALEKQCGVRSDK